MLVFTDSQLALSLVQLGCDRFHQYAAIVGMVHDLLRFDWQVNFRLILREGNAVVDLLAKDGTRDSCRLKLLEDPLQAALPLLADDYCGTLFMRR